MMEGDDHCQCLLLQAFLQVLQVSWKVVFPFVALDVGLERLYLSCYLPQLLQIFQLGIIVIILHH